VLEIDYRVERAGWALAKISDGEETIEMAASYLHDTLKELAESTLQIINGTKNARVVFMDEPGEYQFKLERSSNEDIKFCVYWFDDWESWGMHPSDKFKEVLSGICTIKRLKQQVTNVLWNIQKNMGEEKYKELWCKHEFPSELYKKLNAA
jgi:hypothetical protein